MESKSHLPIKDLMREKKYSQWSLALQFIRALMIMTSLAFVVISNYLKGTPSLGIMITSYVLSMTLFTIPGGRLIEK
ncbi:hypothetical protein [Paenibacillus faecalis]|uniref:hypothetical protein n=1 Tax=Paenibacillus faecalis TaxID=2079532 RepID=UPI000D0F3689|nr:hypothetical protein [Paenibacillus faecalis]